MSEKRENIVLRFGIIYVFVILGFVAVIGKILIIQTTERDEWLALAKRTIKSNIKVEPNRGNIYACDGRLMASSIPTYYVYMDTRVPALHIKGGELFYNNIDSLSMYLSSFFKTKNPSTFKQEITKAYKQGKAEYKLHPKRISYAELKQLKKFPLFRLGRIKSGLITKEQLTRVKPFGSLASRTIGDIFADAGKGGKNGLEKYFNSQLIGTTGRSTRQKVANSTREIVEIEPVDGVDIISTIDIDLQDIAEKTLVDSMRSFGAKEGYVILMETQSGAVKAIVNMQRGEDGNFHEDKNGAVSDRVEPGSTFKVMSLMAALDDGKVKINDKVNTGNGKHQFGNRVMKDWNANKGGFQTITAAEAINCSSNVGISKIIVDAYGENPSEFIDKLYEMGLNDSLHLEINGIARPYIKHPKSSKVWSATSLPWMSIGYEIQIPPIYTLAYFNAIANDGKFIRPTFVKALSRGGQIIKAFETETINEAICKPSTLVDIRGALLGVIEGKMGTAKNVHSKYFSIAGKTGTALIAKNGDYRKYGSSYQVSFCGYFPADKPRYTCIVVIREPQGYPSGGKMAGSVFKSIAEKTIALKTEQNPSTLPQDTALHLSFQPNVKGGNYAALKTVMDNLKLSISGQSAEWVLTKTEGNRVLTQTLQQEKNQIPDVKGLGAKDAVFLLEQKGLRVFINGRGKVVSQQLASSSLGQKNKTIVLHLE